MPLIAEAQRAVISVQAGGGWFGRASRDLRRARTALVRQRAWLFARGLAGSGKGLSAGKGRGNAGGVAGGHAWECESAASDEDENHSFGMRVRGGMQGEEGEREKGIDRGHA
eukprot:12822483-Alexandrium_andersonii.AAC.1